MTNTTNDLPAALLGARKAFEKFGELGGSFYARWIPEPVTEDLQAYVDAVLPFVYLEDASGYARTGSGPYPEISFMGLFNVEV